MPLFSDNGNAVPEVLTDRFTILQIIGKTVIIHNRLTILPPNRQEMLAKKLPAELLENTNYN